MSGAREDARDRTGRDQSFALIGPPGLPKVAPAAVSTSAFLSLAFVAGNTSCQCRGWRHERERTRLTEDHFVALFPHLGDQGLTRVSNASEPNTSGEILKAERVKKDVHLPDFDVFELAEALQDVLARDTHSAKT